MAFHFINCFIYLKINYILFMHSNKIVCYLYTVFDKKKSLTNFIKNYKRYRSGLNHKLVICFKLFNFDEVVKLRKYLKDVNYVEFVDPGQTNDWDFGSYKRISKFFFNKDILFLSSHSYPACNDWLKKLFLFKKKKYCYCSDSILPKFS